MKAGWRLNLKFGLEHYSDMSDKWNDSPLAWGMASWLAGGLNKALLVGGLAYLLQRKRQQQDR